MDHRLDDVERAFREWRRDKRTKEIPEELLEQAVAAARRHGLTKTAMRLRLNYTKLKQRYERESLRAGFVELAASELPFAGESVVELEDEAGSRMRVVLRGASVAAAMAVAKELWSVRR